MATGFKSGGRIKGVSFNKPKVTTIVAAPVVAAAGAAPGLDLPPSRARAKAAKRAPLVSIPLTVEYWPITRLLEYENNPRDNDGQVGRMAESFREYGFRIPIVARSDGTIVDGHLRYKAARKLKLTEVPVALADDLTEAQVAAFRLLANRSATWAGWNHKLLRIEVTKLRSKKVDVERLTGFDPVELATLSEEPGPIKLRPIRTTTKTVTCPKCGYVFTP